ncbi:MAG TPA: hypothetical protein VJ882_03130 [Desulfuromonadales bacterium]|nr:hypothetical protein [Desulfuromonadales bacterium]
MFKKVFTTFTALFSIVTLVSFPAMAEGQIAEQNNTWISISGTVEDVQKDSFSLDYGDGLILVEMDDGDRDADAYKLMAGDKVTVNGMVDNDLFEKASIEAGSIYVEKLGTYFYASAKDEEEKATLSQTLGQTDSVVQGKISDVRKQEFDLNTGIKRITIDVSKLSDNPLDEKGYQKLEPGDIVRVEGDFKKEFFTGRVLVAESVIKFF